MVGSKEDLKDLLESSEFAELFPYANIGGEKMSLFDALENNELSVYVDLIGINTDSKRDVLECLLCIHNELEKEDPDLSSVSEIKDQLDILMCCCSR